MTDQCMYDSKANVRVFMHLLGLDEATGNITSPLRVQSLYVLTIEGKCECISLHWSRPYCKATRTDNNPNAQGDTIGRLSLTAEKRTPAIGTCPPAPNAECKGENGPTTYYIRKMYVLGPGDEGCEESPNYVDDQGNPLIECYGMAGTDCAEEGRECTRRGATGSAWWNCLYEKARNADQDDETACNYDDFLDLAFDAATKNGEAENNVCDMLNSIEKGPRQCGSNYDLNASDEIADKVLQAKYLNEINFERRIQSAEGKGWDILFSEVYNSNNS